jgi:uncharacterized membrane protein
VEIFTQEGGAFLSRWGHFLSGITWIGLLYYFNFVQVPSFAAMEAGTRTEAVRKLASRALWWFRWGAVLTLLTGLSILAFNEQLDGDYFKTAPGIAISTGVLLALVMFANVWLVIWPNQKVVIASAERVAGGGEADPGAAPATRRGLLASRTNTLFSIPMLFFMGATSHFAGSDHFEQLPEGGGRLAYWLIVLVIVAVVELNALGYLGGTGPGPLKKPLEAVPNVIVAGFVLWVVLYLLWEILLRA